MSLKDVLSFPYYDYTLPSGIKVKYRPFVVKEEKILLIAKESKDSNQIFESIKAVIKNCVVEPEKFNIEKLPYYDVQQLFVMLRSKSMGEKVQIRVKDPETNQSFDTEMDLNEIKTENISIKNKKIKLNESLAIEFKYPTFSQIINLKIDKKEEESNLVDVIIKFASLCIEKVYSNEKIINCSDLSPDEIKEFIENLQKEEFLKFCDFYKNMPKLVYRTKFTNPTTGNSFDVEVNDFTNFFIF